MAKHGEHVFTMSDVPTCTFGCPNLKTIATCIVYIFQLHSLAGKKTDRTFLVTLYYDQKIQHLCAYKAQSSIFNSEQRTI